MRLSLNTHLSIHSFIDIYSIFLHSSIHPFTHSSIYPFIHLSIYCIDRNKCILLVMHRMLVWVLCLLKILSVMELSSEKKELLLFGRECIVFWRWVTWLWFYHPYIHIIIILTIHLFIYLSVYSSICLDIHPSIHPSICQSIHSLSIHSSHCQSSTHSFIHSSILLFIIFNLHFLISFCVVFVFIMIIIIFTCTSIQKSMYSLSNYIINFTCLL